MRMPLDDTTSDGPNLTPVIDVVFLLLIFFLVATQFAEEEKEMESKMTEVAKAEPLAGGNQVIVNVMKDGKYVVRQKTYNEAQLRSHLKAVQDKNPQYEVLIRGDRTSELQHSLKVMGVCNLLKMKYKVAAVEKPPR